MIVMENQHFYGHAIPPGHCTCPQGQCACISPHHAKHPTPCRAPSPWPQPFPPAGVTFHERNKRSDPLPICHGSAHDGCRLHTGQSKVDVPYQTGPRIAALPSSHPEASFPTRAWHDGTPPANKRRQGAASLRCRSADTCLQRWLRRVSGPGPGRSPRDPHTPRGSAQ